MSMTLVPKLNAHRIHRHGWVGIDIGSTAIKFAVVSKRDGQFTVERKQIIPVTSTNGHLNTAREASRAYSNWLKKLPGAPAAIACSLDLDLRSLEVPPNHREDIESYLSNQPGLVGSGITTAVWPTTWNMPLNEMLPCHVFGFHQVTADEIAHSIHQSGLNPEAMESIPHVLARLPKLNNWQESGVQGVIDWAADNPLFVLSRHGEPYYTRLIKRCSYTQLVHEVSEKLKLEETDVWQLLSELGRASTTNQRFSKILSTLREVSQTTRQALLTEISKTIEFLRNEDKQLLPEKLWVVGAGASYPFVSQLIEDAIEIPTEVWSLPGEDEKSNDLAFYASAISLSARPFFR